MSIIIFIIILAILIFVHELGHFLVAKKSGIRVDEFGLGFPPKIFSKKLGETTYTLNAVPFGGFVKIFGEDPVVEQSSLRSEPQNINIEDQRKNFQFKPRWIQASVLVAGVLFNILFAWLLFSIGFTIGMPSSISYSDLVNKKAENLIILEVAPNSPAQKAGLVSGDKIVSISSGDGFLQGENLIPENVKKIISESEDKIKITYYDTKDVLNDTFVQPEINPELKVKTIGILMADQVIKLPVHLAVIEGAHTTWILTKQTVVGLIKFLWDTVSFKSDFSQVAGPIGIAGIVSQASNSGFVYLLFFVALISINLAVINLLPFPALDGGRLLFVGIEAIIRRPINPVFVRWSNGIGFALLLILMVIITGHDILKLI